VVDDLIYSGRSVKPGVTGGHGGLHPVLVQWRGIRIYSYPVMIYLGLTLGIILGNSMARAAALDPFCFFAAVLILAALGLIGARLSFVAANWKYYRQRPRSIWKQAEGGAAVLGGLVLSVAISPLVLLPLDLPLGLFWDSASFVMLVWSIFGRLGCFLHGCCSGKPSGGFFALHLPDHCGVWRRRIPTQLLESALGGCILAMAGVLWAYRPFPGALFLICLTGYGLGRAALYPLRDSYGGAKPSVLYQGLAAACGVLALGTFAILWLHTA
jgi:phosphatidylglycerol:prolipoprotein diacylglycerol transferase